MSLLFLKRRSLYPTEEYIHPKVLRGCSRPEATSRPGATSRPEAKSATTEDASMPGAAVASTATSWRRWTARSGSIGDDVVGL